MIRKSTPFSLLLALVLFAGAFAWYAFAGDQNDDYVYLHEFVNDKPFGATDDFDLCVGDPVTTPGQVVSSVWKHYIYWGNGRLGSAIMFATNLFPACLVDAVNALMLTAMFLLSMRLALGPEWRRRPLTCMLLCSLMWWVLPWHEFMLATSFAINYIWGAVFCLWFLLLLFTGRGKTWAVCLLAFIAGTMHEGTSVMIDVILLCYCLQRLVRWGWDGRFMIPCIVFAVSSLAVIFSPSVLTRSDGGGMFRFAIWLPALFNIFFIRQYFFTLMLIVTLGVCIFLPSDRFKTFWNMAWPVYVGTAVGIMFIDFMLPGNMERCMWLCNVLLIILAVRLLRHLHLPGGVVWRRVCAFTLLGCMGVWMGAVASVQWKLREETDHIASLYVAWKSPIVYAESTAREYLPWWTLGIPMTIHDSVLGLSFHLHSLYLSDNIRGDKINMQRKCSQIIVLDPADSLVRFDRLPLMAGNMKARRSGHTFYIDSLHGWEALYSLSDSDPREGVRIPWLKFRLWNKPSEGFVNKRHIYLKTVAVTPEMRRRGVVPPGLDTVYFFSAEGFSYPRMLYGLHVERIDTVHIEPPKKIFRWILPAVSTSLTPTR